MKTINFIILICIMKDHLKKGLIGKRNEKQKPTVSVGPEVI
jgi:hypothetical protein